MSIPRCEFLKIHKSWQCFLQISQLSCWSRGGNTGHKLNCSESQARTLGVCPRLSEYLRSTKMFNSSQGLYILPLSPTFRIQAEAWDVCSHSQRDNDSNWKHEISPQGQMLSCSKVRSLRMTELCCSVFQDFNVCQYNMITASDSWQLA